MTKWKTTMLARREIGTPRPLLTHPWTPACAHIPLAAARRGPQSGAPHAAAAHFRGISSLHTHHESKFNCMPITSISLITPASSGLEQLTLPPLAVQLNRYHCIRKELLCVESLPHLVDLPYCRYPLMHCRNYGGAVRNLGSSGRQYRL